jgi:hypothetical protein
MLFLKLVLLLNLISFSLGAFAVSSLFCDGKGLSTINDAKISYNLIYPTGDLPTCDTLNIFNNTLIRINKFSPQTEVQSLLIFHKAKNASSRLNGTVIKIPHTLLSVDSSRGLVKERSTDEMLVWFAHEYGHSIFTKMLAEDFPAFSKLRSMDKMIGKKEALLNKYEQSIQKLTLEYELYKNDGRSDRMEITLNKLRVVGTKWNTLNEEIISDAKAFNKSESIIRLGTIIKPYSEYFADVVAALTFKSPTAFADSMRMDGSSEEYSRNVKNRDFTNFEDAETWSDSTSHGMLTPARYHFWKYMWPNNFENETLQNTLIQVYKGIRTEILKRYKENKPLTATEANQGLISTFMNN